MIGVVEEHNRLTGYRFVIVEYVTVGAVLASSAAGTSWLAARWMHSSGWGQRQLRGELALLAEAQLRGGAPDIGIRAMRTGPRDRIRREQPHLLRHTLALVTISMLPLLLLAMNRGRERARCGSAAADRLTAFGSCQLGHSP